MGKKYAIVGGKLVDGTGSAPVENALILIGEDGRIEYAGKHEDVPAEAGYNSIDAAGKTVMPGLIDTHLHFSGNLTDDDTDWVMQPLLEKQAVAVKQAYDCLTHGLTTVCEVGRFGIHVRNCINNGVFKGPRIYATGLGFAALQDMAIRTAAASSRTSSRILGAIRWMGRGAAPCCCLAPAQRTPMPSRFGLPAAVSGVGTPVALSIIVPRKSRR